MKHFILGTLVLLTLVGCATFGIHNANSEDGREGRDYTLLVRAWDKKAPNVAVTFLYRINGGAWNEARGVFNGSMYEARINGSQLPAGILEYYAWMTNAKGERVNSQPVQIRILSFAEARAKAERQYQARLADAGTDKEFFFNDTGRIRLQVRGGDPASLSLLLNPERPFQVQTTRNGDLTRHEAEIEAPHRVRSYGYQWKAVWNDPEFGEIISVFPQAPAQVPVIDSAVLRERLEKEIIAAFSHQAPVKGSFAAPPNAQVSLADNALLSRFSAGARTVTLLLRKGTFVRAIPMTEQAKGRFTLALPVQDLEDGALSYSFVYSEVFKDIGKIDYTYPQSGSLLVEYTTLEQLRKALSEQLSTKIVHAAPAQIEENQNITLEMRLSDTSLSIQSSSVELQAYPSPRAIATFSPGAAQGSFFTALPSQLIPTILLEYRIAVTVQDPALGKVTGYLPAAGFFRVPVVKPGTATPTPAATATPAPATPIPVVTATPTATPSPQATPTPTVTPGPAPTFNPVNYYRGNRDTRQGVRFYVTLPNELGLFDIKVMVKVQNRDQDFKEYPLTRKGKEYSYTFPTLTLLIGNRIDYYYVVYYKGNLVQNLTDANAVPFYTIIN